MMMPLACAARFYSYWGVAVWQCCILCVQICKRTLDCFCKLSDMRVDLISQVGSIDVCCLICRVKVILVDQLYGRDSAVVMMVMVLVVVMVLVGVMVLVVVMVLVTVVIMLNMAPMIVTML